MLKSTLGIQFAQNQKALFITSKKHANAVAEGKVANPVKDAKRAMLGKHVAGGFMRFAGMADVIEVMAEGDENAEQAIKILRKFDEASFTSNMLSMKGKLTFKDKKTNSLKQLVDMTTHLSQEYFDNGFGGDFEPEAHEHEAKEEE